MVGGDGDGDSDVSDFEEIKRHARNTSIAASR
jgi:hypothetical protein